MSDEAKLKHYLNKYKNPEACRRDVLNAVQFYKGLAFFSETFTFNDGSCRELVNLAGTIPIVYKGGTYNIPICVWLMNTHPQNPPLCFVRPTPDMSIKESKYVDNNGRVYLPLLHEWHADRSNLVALVRGMIAAFGELPPVYSKGPGQQQQQQQRPAAAAAVQPPYPTASYMPQPYPYQPYGAPYPGAAATTGGYPPYPPVGGGEYPPQPQPPTQDPSAGGTITENHIKASLYSAVEDKLKRRMREQYLQNQAELDTLRRTQQELADGKARLDDTIGRLERERAELDANVDALREKEKELRDALEKLSDREGVDPDEAVATTAPLYAQLLNAFAEEATTEDAIYYMGEALRTGVIDLDAFLKQVRALSRKQFTLRALMQKCRQRAGLAC